jgi:hypothetical protein
MNTTRPFNVVRRRPNILDLLIPKQANVKGYRLQAATNFDATFTTILTADISSGYLDPAVDRNKLNALNNPNQIRVVFDPQTFFTPTGIEDSKQFWLKFVPVNFAGVPGTASSPCLILPDSNLRGDSRAVIHGDAPSGTTVANSLEILLPFRTQDLEIRNREASTDLYVALSEGGHEILLDAGATTLSQVEFEEGPVESFLVRGSGGTANFSASFTSWLPL